MGRLVSAAAAVVGLLVGATPALAGRLRLPRSARQVVVVSSPTADPHGSLATLRAYARLGRSSRWRLAYGPWAAEIGRGQLVAAARRREGDGATPIGVFSFGHTIYGVAADPGGLHYHYHRLVCGDWWDEDPYSALYNHFVHVACGTSPSFGGASEALWTEPLAYAYFAVINFNRGPVQHGAEATGSGIFLHSWINSATQGCVALPRGALLALLRWLRPGADPVIEIGTDAELAGL